MSTVKLKYEVLVSGLYPLVDEFEKNGYTLVKNRLDINKLNYVYEAGLIYLSPYIGYCCSSDGSGNMIYLTFEKEKVIDVDYDCFEEYDREFTLKSLEYMDVFREVFDLERIMILEVNNGIKFPIKMVKAYDKNNGFVTMCADFTNPNIPGLLSNNDNS